MAFIFLHPNVGNINARVRMGFFELLNHSTPPPPNHSYLSLRTLEAAIQEIAQVMSKPPMGRCIVKPKKKEDELEWTLWHK